MTNSKCVSCGYSKPSNSFIFGVCVSCQDFILKSRQYEDQIHHNKWCSEESILLQKRKDEFKKAVSDLKNAEIGLQIINLIKSIK